MKLLLDENLPKRLKEDFPDHEIYTVRDMGWNGKSDAELLALLEQEGFHALLTFDKNMRYQQNFSRIKTGVFVLSGSINSYQEMTRLSPLVNAFLNKGISPVGAVIVRGEAL